MYYLTKRFKFDSAHYLKGYVGKCSALHGHTFKLDVTLAFKDLNEVGMGMDFADIKLLVQKVIIDKLDHKVLNNVCDFNPTAENLAQWIFKVLDNIFESDEYNLHSVKVWETEDSCAEFKRC